MDAPNPVAADLDEKNALALAIVTVGTHSTEFTVFVFLVKF